MKRLSCLIILFSITFSLHAQEKKSKPNAAIDAILKQLKEFRQNERKQDSAAGHPLGSSTEEYFAKRYSFFKTIDGKLKAVDRSRISFDDEINLDLLEYDVEDELGNYEFKAYLNPILADGGFHTDLPLMASGKRTTKKDFENYINWMKDVPRYVQENLSLMRKGLELGICQPRVILSGYENTYEQQITDTVEKSIFYKSFLQRPPTIDEADWKTIREEGALVVKENVIASYRQIKTFFDNEYLPKTRTTIGVSNFPNGLAYYRERVHHYTTTDMSYEEIYQLGLKEVERIKKLMDEVLKQVNFTGSMQQFIDYLRTDPKFYATTPEQLLKEASYVAKEVDGKLPLYFGKLPRLPYGVVAVPAHLAPVYTMGRYQEGAGNGTRAGFYWVNTWDLKSRPLYALESLTLHEAVPGHHLQISLAKELTNVPEFRRGLYVNVFGEGWGLYCEYLGEEMGLYKDPYSKFGRLTYEMWRACRLVIDVGLHAKGWTREQAVKYLAENTALSLHEVNTEINRYISWPGQALAYKMGELKIKELRKRAEEKLGTRFDIREFHDVVLSQGAVTLNILEKMVDRYIEGKLKPVKPQRPYAMRAN